MRVHGDRLVGPFERRLVRDMVGIEADMAVRAFQARCSIQSAIIGSFAGP